MDCYKSANNYTYKCGCGINDWRDDFRTDCYFYAEDKDMGATIPWCCKLHKVIEPRDCGKDCKFFISKHDVNEMVNERMPEEDENAST